MVDERPHAWVATEADADERRVHASRLVGLELSGVRYVTLDYCRHEFAPGATGPRFIAGAAEWQHPTWQYDDCDSVDFGVEITTTSGRAFSVAWDAPGDHESLGLRELALLGSRFDTDRDVAVWDVTRRSRWRGFLDAPVQRVDLHYLPWGDEGFWCPRVTLTSVVGTIELLLGEGRSSADVGPASDNVAVLFDPPSLPSWQQS